MDVALLMVAGGGECPDDLRMLRADQGLKELLGREGLLAPTTAGEMLRRFSPGSLEALGGVNTRLVRKVAGRERLTEATLDVDSSVVEARKKDCERGYNPSSGDCLRGGQARAHSPGKAFPPLSSLRGVQHRAA